MRAGEGKNPIANGIGTSVWPKPGSRRWICVRVKRGGKRSNRAGIHENGRYFTWAGGDFGLFCGFIGVDDMGCIYALIVPLSRIKDEEKKMRTRRWNEDIS
jgi:hypothetical protein